MINKLRKTGIILLGMLAASVFSPGCRQGKDVKVIRLAHILPTDHSVHLAMEYMAQRVKEKSGGKLRIKIYPNGQLGNEKECVELLQLGSLGMTKVSAAVVEGFADEYKVLGLPYLFDSTAHAEAVLDGDIGQQFLLSTEDVWLRGVCFYDAGARSFYTTSKPVNTPADLKGLNIRVMKSITANKMMTALGANPTPIPFGELYTALQSGVVDGAENNPPSFSLSKHYEQCRYYSLDEHTMIPDVLLISTHVWDDLTEQEKQWLQEAADESVTYQRELWKESEKEALAKVEAAGVIIIRPDKKPFRDKVKKLYGEYKKYPKLYKMIEAIQNTKPLPHEDEAETNN